jgi:uncharacterized cupredoxin-like copper-binding protein
VKVQLSRKALRDSVRLAVLALVLGIAVALVGFHGHPHSHGELTVRDSNGQTVSVGDWKLGDFPNEVPAVLKSGELEFTLANADLVAHDFYVVQTNREADALPAADGRVDVERLGAVYASVRSFQPGERSSMSFKFPPGKYVLYCNQAGHYQHGMYYSFEVQ